jgi:hypothetical protein
MEMTMKGIIILATLLNISVAGMTTLIVSGPSRTNPENDFEKGLARMAVREKLGEALSVDAESILRLNKGCTEQKENGALIVGDGETFKGYHVLAGVPVTEAARFSYRASVSANCDKYNLNCYSISGFSIDGLRSVTPRL